MPRRNKHVPAYQLVVGDEIPTYGEHGGPYRRVSQIDQNGPRLTVIYDDGDNHRFAWNNTVVIKDTNLADWERQLLAPADARKLTRSLVETHPSSFPLGPPDIRSMLKHPDAPGGNHMSRSARDINDRLEQLNSQVASAQREIHFLSTLPAEPEVDPDEVEPTVLLLNKLHPDTGKVVKSTVIRSHAPRQGAVGWINDSSDGYTNDWQTTLRHAFDCNSDFEIRQLNPGTVIYTTVPAPAKTRKRTTT